MSNYYPPVSFYFEANITGAAGTHDASFTEASGLDAEREVVEIKEGGENRFSHRVPGRVKYTNLVLKRGIMTKASPLFDWCKEALESDLGQKVTTRDISVSLLDRKGSPLMSWNVVAAWPVKWNVAGFDATENKVAMETLEFAYARQERERIPSDAEEAVALGMEVMAALAK